MELEDDKSLVLRPELLQAYARKRLTQLREALVKVTHTYTHTHILTHCIGARPYPEAGLERR